MLLLNGHMAESLLLNPLGAIGLVALVVIPLWLAADLLMKKESLHRQYAAAERTLRQKSWASIPLISVVIVNWIWNIVKGL